MAFLSQHSNGARRERTALSERHADGTVQELQRPRGRLLGFNIYGDPEGFPVLAFHGVPGTRLMFRTTDDIATRLGLCIIAPDRPGFGRSTAQPDRRLQDWLPDVEAILSACHIGRFALIGVSGGSPFATATAEHFGNRVAAMVLFGPMGPVAEMKPDEFSWMDRNIFIRLLQTQLCLRASLSSANTCFMSSPKFAYNVFLMFLPPCDRKIMRQPRLKERVLEDVTESLAQGGEGMRSDLRIYGKPWQVDYKKITAPTVLWQGLDDNIVPIIAALRLGELIPNCAVHRLPGAGHFWIYDHIELVLTTLRTMACDDLG